MAKHNPTAVQRPVKDNKQAERLTTGAVREVRQREMRGEMAGLVLLGAGMAFAASLASHDPRDMAAVAAGKGAEQVANWLGPVGARIADLLLHFFGLGAFLLNVLVLALALATLTGRMRAPRLSLAVGAFGASLSGLVLLHLIAQRWNWRPLGKDAAGLIPGGVAMVLKAMLKTTGTALVAAVALMASMAAISGRSLTSMFVRWVSRKAVPVVEGAAAKTTDAAQKSWLQLGNTVRSTMSSKSHAASNARLQAVEPDHAGDIGDDMDGSSIVTAKPPLPAAPDKEFTFSAADFGMAPPPSDELPQTAVAKPRYSQPIPPLPAMPAVAPSAHSKSVHTQPMHGNTVPAYPLSSSEASVPAAAPRTTHGPTLRMNAVEVDQVQAELDSAAMGEDPEIGAAFIMPVVDDRVQMALPATAVVGPKAVEFSQPRIIETEALRCDAPVRTVEAVQQSLAIDGKSWILPSSSLLQEPPTRALTIDEDTERVLRENAVVLAQKLADFGITGTVQDIRPGPVVTTYEFRPSAGIKISKITNLKDDLTMSLSALNVRVVAPVPGKDVVGIEVPNHSRQIVYFREVLERREFHDARGQLTLILGKDIEGKPMLIDLAKAPHLLVAGATGTGKSVGINSFICSLLFHCTPKDLRMIFIDPKRVELASYADIPHLLLPVLEDSRKAELALKWAVNEMERRYKLLQLADVRNLAGYKDKLPEMRAMATRKALLESRDGEHCAPEMPEDPPFIVVVIDEFADLIMEAGKAVEVPVARLAQKARAAGIHVILATQRPSTDVITGIIKANFPTRISFKVSSSIDSRVVLGAVGAETLLGNGDMLVVPPNDSALRRCHGTWITDGEVLAIAKHWKEQGTPIYEMDILTDPEAEETESDSAGEMDALYSDAVQAVVEKGEASISFLQRKFSVGYGRAAKIMDGMERARVVGPSRGPNKPREILAQRL